jgi:hypothetical protein
MGLGKGKENSVAGPLQDGTATGSCQPRAGFVVLTCGGARDVGPARHPERMPDVGEAFCTATED